MNDASFSSGGAEDFEDLQAVGRFRPIVGMREGKWFADTLDGVRLHGDKLYPRGAYRIVAADIPEEMFEGLFRSGNLDRFGPATYFEHDELERIVLILEP